MLLYIFTSLFRHDLLITCVLFAGDCAATHGAEEK